MGGISILFEMISRSCSLTKSFHSLRARELRQYLTLSETIAPQMVDREMTTAQCTMHQHGSACCTVQRQAYALRTTTFPLTHVSRTSTRSISPVLMTSTSGFIRCRPLLYRRPVDQHEPIAQGCRHAHPHTSRQTCHLFYFPNAVGPYHRQR